MLEHKAHECSRFNGHLIMRSIDKYADRCLACPQIPDFLRILLVSELNAHWTSIDDRIMVSDPSMKCLP